MYTIAVIGNSLRGFMDFRNEVNPDVIKGKLPLRDRFEKDEFEYFYVNSPDKTRGQTLHGYIELYDARDNKFFDELLWCIQPAIK